MCAVLTIPWSFKTHSFKMHHKHVGAAEVHKMQHCTLPKGTCSSLVAVWQGGGSRACLGRRIFGCPPTPCSGSGHAGTILFSSMPRMCVAPYVQSTIASPYLSAWPLFQTFASVLTMPSLSSWMYWRRRFFFGRLWICMCFGRPLPRLEWYHSS